MSTDSSQFEVVPANASALDNDVSSHMSMLYQDIVRNPELFWEMLRDFHESSDKKFKIPIVGGKSLDLHRLFNEVTSRGGLEKVIKDRRCKEVIDAFNFKTTITNSAFVLRKSYLKMLFEFEHLYYFQAPLSTFWEKEKALKLLIEKSANRDKDSQELKPGTVITGIIDGKFESGYLISTKVGSEKLKGMLYHISPETKRGKKKAKSSQGDSHKPPKRQRTGYNFFVAEQSVRIKAENAGQKVSSPKNFGNMWTNLSESDRKVYYEKSREDGKRYKMEILQYRSLMESRVAEIVAATDAGTSASAAETADEASQENLAKTDACTSASSAAETEDEVSQ
ncbi:HMG (high mobility group) box protein with ARID/BRIGHT DNA-binding domain-containing protein [Arabidopsis thaliana]|uniref:Putative high mobility group B protein 11 n=1 Tax=Arabidopsis thaliana TaxID=3702 RepID=HMG11_ARATH|nr:HMG (high mobility group) box protein with ARID/BRIGHT DNA-binding domain-containing protein [Arabidopsis thaliana]Q9LG02.2 RecName: Full=Putative high mobility group B protein 11; AltName: Full=Nucleosome/chromatin assembly factor group D 11 [Arabidopsis thaliana]AEE33278.1 HMG (high mobility group) box protein with ARID/BRIGHT DNA-binding domain-containing protein [Arabidopsis thaliana]|eukprot:NP_175961.1 HMG (high mobility group) box protein with ARID/BRIGHT DNA-binding domain-containing protein [Arabidopsis thaliana]